jgi:chemotaxis-related protein WspB
MLLLLFQVDQALYAIDATQVIEVLPLVLLRKNHQLPNHVAGLFSYRNCIVPVIDLCQLIRGEPVRSRYSTRIIMVQYTQRNGNRAYVGLLAERVTETLNYPNLIPATQRNTDSFLGEILMHEKGMIQRVNWEPLVSDVQSAMLMTGGT